VAFASATAEHDGSALSGLGTITLNNGKQLRLRGGVFQGNAAFTADLSGATDTVLEFDASQATSTANTNYAWFEGTANTQTNCRMLTSGTTGRLKLRSNSGGGNGFFARGIDIGANGAFVDTTFWSVENVDFLRVGDSTRDKIVFNPSSTTFTYKFKNCTSDACGSEFWASNIPSAGSLDYNGNIFSNGAYRTILSVPNPVRFAVTSTTTGTRLVTNCSFDRRPVLRGGAISYTNSYFHQGWDPAADSVNWTSMDGCTIRLIDSATQATNGPVTNCIVWFDPPQTQLVTGTATAGSSTTLTDTGKTFTVNQYLSAPGSATYQLHITGGTGSGQRRRISGNTATVLTVKPNWVTAPDATSTYEIIQDGNNYHALAAGPNAINQAFTGNIFGSSSVDSDGDGIKQFSVAATYDISTNIVLPNASGVDTTCCLITMFSNTNASAVVNCLHNTVCIGLQSAFQIDEGGHAQAAGTLGSVKSNAVWSPRAYTEYPTGLAGFIILDDGDLPGSAVTDVCAPANADYNGRFNMQAGGTGTVGGNCYGYRVSTNPGTHDVTGDPQFLAPTRNIDTWDATLGGSGTWSAALARMQAAPSTIAAALTYIKAGFAPQNAAYIGTAHDGGNIGAV
jgi:hypothetical protein